MYVCLVVSNSGGVIVAMSCVPKSATSLSCAGVDQSHSTFWSATQSLLVGYQGTIPQCRGVLYICEVASLNWKLSEKPGLNGTHNCLTFLPHVKTASLFKIKPACILCRTSINNAAGLTCASCLRSPLSRLAFKRTAAMSRRYRGSRSHRRHSCCCASNRRTR